MSEAATLRLPRTTPGGQPWWPWPDFRYDRQGGELCRFDFEALDQQMDHLRQVLEGIWTCLYEMRAEIAEYEAELQAEFGNDMYW